MYIMIDGKELIQLDNFTYLGGIISQDGSNSQDIKQRIGKAMKENSTIYGTQQTSECQQRQNYTEY